MNPNTDLIGLTADIVAAHAANNTVPVADMPGLISSVYGALSDLGTPKLAAPEVHEPVVSIRASVKPDRVTCLCCGYEGKMLKRHLMTAHGLTPEEYRARYSLKADHPLVAPDYAAVRADLAKKIGLGRKPGARK